MVVFTLRQLIESEQHHDMRLVTEREVLQIVTGFQEESTMQVLEIRQLQSRVATLEHALAGLCEVYIQIKEKEEHRD